MDKQREKLKLIELLDELGVIVNVPIEVDEDGCGTYEIEGSEYVADHLLANGVIVLPCGKGTKLKYDGIDYEVDHWNILASAFNDEARNKGKSGIHLFDIEDAEKALDAKDINVPTKGVEG